MAELSYDDVRQATSAAVAGLQSAISDVRNNIQTARNDISRLSLADVQNRLSNIERVVGDIAQYLHRLEVLLQSNPNVTNDIQQATQATARVEQRVVNAEHMIADMSQYLEVIHQQLVQLTEIQIQPPGGQAAE